MTIRYYCVSCKREFKTERSPGQLVTHSICSDYCKQSLDLWLLVPHPQRGRLQDFHRERVKMKGVA